jgi:hypothetical protein
MMKHNAFLINKIEWVQLLLSGILFCVWSIPHTSALRNIILLILLGSIFLKAHYCSPLSIFKQAPGLSLIVIVSTLWLFINATIITSDIKESIEGLSSLWLKNILILWIGLQLGLVAREKRNALQYLFLVLALGLAILILHNLGYTIYCWWKTKNLLFYPAPLLLSSKVQMSYIINLFLAMLITDFASRIETQKAIFPVSFSVLILLVVMTLLAMYGTGARNGIISSLLLLVSTGLLILFHLRKFTRWDKMVTMLVCLVLAAGGLGYISYRGDSRWQKIKDTLPYALDIVNQRAWLDKRLPLPEISPGNAVDESAYLRVAFIRAGFDFMLRYPLGVGLSKTAFTQAQALTYGIKNRHAHSGLIEWGVGAGIPGLLLFYLFTGWFFIQGVTLYWHQKNTYGLLLMLTVSGFWGRMIIENITRDHMLEMLFFMLGIYAALAGAFQLPKQTPQKHPLS